MTSQYNGFSSTSTNQVDLLWPQAEAQEVLLIGSRLRVTKKLKLKLKLLAAS
jgi:hypothetical protein